jgi:site-specific DNA recombinase
LNLKKSVKKGLEIAQNIIQIWVSEDLYDKQQLQYLLFPEGMLYDKENRVVRTTKINYLFSSIAI